MLGFLFLFLKEKEPKELYIGCRRLHLYKSSLAAVVWWQDG
jgi:hypothetical protein